MSRAWIRRPVMIGSLAGAALVLLVGATTTIFEGSPDGSAYEAGFDAGFVQGAEVPDGARARLESAAYGRGLRAASSFQSSGSMEAVRLVALFAVTTPGVSADSYDVGFAEGLRDAEAGRPPRIPLPSS